MIQELQKKIVKFRDDRDWKRFHTPKNLSMALSVEASELVEIFQWIDEARAGHFVRDKKNLEMIADEVADIAIYLLSFCEVTGIDLCRAIETKIEKNRQKYVI